MHRRSRENRLRGVGGFFAFAVLSGFAGLGALSQQPAGAQAAPQRSVPVQSAVPGQPPLDVDRDPVPSPDPDPPPQSIGNEQPGPSAGTIARGTGGQYTLHEDAYEVRLNASVFDASGHSVQTLDKDALHVYEDGVPQNIADFSI